MPDDNMARILLLSATWCEQKNKTGNDADGQYSNTRHWPG